MGVRSGSSDFGHLLASMVLPLAFAVLLVSLVETHGHISAAAGGSVVTRRSFGDSANTLEHVYKTRYGQPTKNSPDIWSKYLGSMRIWDCYTHTARGYKGCSWAGMETSRGDWSNGDAVLSEYMKLSNAYRLEVTLAISRTPPWASLFPSNICHKDGSTRNEGECFPPRDIDDASTTCSGIPASFRFGAGDCIWKEHIYHLASTWGCRHNATYNCILNWEIGNEPNAENFWYRTGKYSNGCASLNRRARTQCEYTSEQRLFRLIRDAHTILKAVNPKLRVLLPAGQGYDGTADHGGPGVIRWLARNDITDVFGNKYPDGILAYADVATFHGYFGNPGGNPNFPEVLAQNSSGDPTKGYVPLVRANLPIKYKNIPLWDTENGFVGSKNLFCNTRDGAHQRAAWISRDLILHVAEGVDVDHWYMWDNTGSGTGSDLGTGTEYWPAEKYVENEQRSSPPCGDDIGANATGKAHYYTAGWLLGSTLDLSGCHADGDRSLWYCDFTRRSPAGYRARVVWSTKSSVDYDIDSQIPWANENKFYRVDGTDSTVRNQRTSGTTKVTVGIEPTWFTNQR